MMEIRIWGNDGEFGGLGGGGDKTSFYHIEAPDLFPFQNLILNMSLIT